MIAYRAPRPHEWSLAQDLLCDLAAADGGLASPRNEALLAALGSDPQGWLGVLLAVRDTDEVLGISTFTPDFSAYRAVVGTYIADLYIRPEARGLRLGRGLIRATEAEARRRWGAVFVSLNVHSDNDGGRGFYEAMGFVLREDCQYLILEGKALEALKE
ncbi:GNAT family N-acetyltransferase [Neotabrizicola sp. sgz301269]|uniref:GNAT family N-acetyltransferase n=1 Tax=Neotabrizicola sp. sgz301269 TaxID=3276282 RepID=UPI00376F5062